MKSWILILGAASVCAGCGGSIPPPNDAFAAAQADVGRAEAGGAQAVPDARLHVQLALEDLQKSRQLMGVDNRRAQSLCALASAEAQLAISLAKEAHAEEDARRSEAALHR
jgi:hypothetical protein